MTQIPKTDDDFAEALAGKIRTNLIRYGLGRERLGKEDAEDFADNAIGRAWECRHQFRGESSLSTWVTRIAIGMRAMELRKKHPPLISLENEDGNTIEIPVAENQFRHAVGLQLHRQIETLRPAQRMAVDYKLREYTPAETAKETGIRVTVVKAHLHRGLSTLREMYPAPPRRSGESFGI